MPDNPHKDRHCATCESSTDHELEPSREGCAWRCTACETITHAYTHADMLAQVIQRSAGLPPASTTTLKVPENLRVFLEHHGPNSSEKEVSREDVLAHAAITGKLPIVGAPMFTQPAGTTHPAMAIPYGKVIRIAKK